MGLKEELELRGKIKGKKPDFVRQDFHKKRLKKKWKKARGLHSKVRLMFRGKPKKISTGFSAPKKVRGLHRSGLKPVLVNSLKDIGKIKKEIECVIIRGNVGLKKKQELLKKLKEINVEILNIKNVDSYLKKIEDELKARKERKKKLTEKKKKEEKKPKKEKKLSEKITEEEKKKEEKKEKDEVLTKKI